MTILFAGIDTKDLVKVNEDRAGMRGATPARQRVAVAGIKNKNSVITDIRISEDVASVMGIASGDRVTVDRVRNKEYVIVMQKANATTGTYAVRRQPNSKQLTVRITGILNAVQATTDTTIVGVQKGALAFDISK